MCAGQTVKFQQGPPHLRWQHIRQVLALQVTAPLDFLLELPNLRILMMGKLEGTWSPQSMAYINDFTKKQMRRNPERDVLLISCPDNILGSLIA